MEFRFLFLLLFSLILTSCEKKERTLSVEEAKKIYDRMSDNEVRTHFREVILSQCHSKLNRLGNQVPSYVNKDNVWRLQQLDKLTLNYYVSLYYQLKL